MALVMHCFSIGLKTNKNTKLFLSLASKKVMSRRPQGFGPTRESTIQHADDLYPTVNISLILNCEFGIRL